RLPPVPLFIISCFFFCTSLATRAVRSFPTRRSSDLLALRERFVPKGLAVATPVVVSSADGVMVTDPEGREYIDFVSGIGALNLGDRKSTRLNSSHVKISYAVFCLKKKIRLLGINNVL